MTVQITLGDFTFARYEIPESLSFGTAQKTNVHTLVGGAKVIDALGPVPVNPSWSGYFVGEAGFNRARYLEHLANAGKPLAFTYSELSYSVLIVDFKAEFKAGPYTPYSIALEVIADNTAPVLTAPDPAPEQLVNDDLASANVLAGGIADPTLTALMTVLSTAISSVGSFAQAASSAVSALQIPIANAVVQVNALLAGNTAVLGAAPGVAGIVGGGDPLTLAAMLTGQLSAVQVAPDLVALSNTLGRMSANIVAVGSGTGSITVGGGNLFAIASAQYGDPMAWTALAGANGISDPQLSGITTLIVPADPSVSSGGVLNG